MKYSLLRRLIREILSEIEDDEVTSSDQENVESDVVANNNELGGFYDYDLPRGVDIFSYWYRSPGRPMGSDGDPGRPEDSKKYIGMTTDDVENDSEI